MMNARGRRFVVNVSALALTIAQMAAAGVAGPAGALEKPSPAPTIKALIGSRAPDFALSDLHGRTWRLSQLRPQKIVVIQFASTSCACGQRAVFDFQGLHNALGERGVQVLAIGFEQQPLRPPAEFMAESQLTIPFLTDPDLKTARAYGVRWPLSVIVIDRMGIVRWVWDDFRGDVFERAKAMIEPLVAADEAWSAGGTYARLFSTGRQATLTGVVGVVEQFTPLKGMSPAVVLTLQGKSPAPRVVLGPAWYVASQAAKISAGDRIRVTGASVLLDGKPFVLASHLRRGRQVLALRNPSGRFMWTATATP
jgi:peroxiredoxin Q/BCP